MNLLLQLCVASILHFIYSLYRDEINYPDVKYPYEGWSAQQAQVLYSNGWHIPFQAIECNNIKIIFFHCWIYLGIYRVCFPIVNWKENSTNVKELRKNQSYIKRNISILSTWNNIDRYIGLSINLDNKIDSLKSMSVSRFPKFYKFKLHFPLPHSFTLIISTHN